MDAWIHKATQTRPQADQSNNTQTTRLCWKRPRNREKHLIQSVEAYRERYSHYPARILPDKLFRTRENYRFCKENGIKVSLFKLGCPPKNLSGEQIRDERLEEGLRNEVEGKFGTGKRKYTLSRLLTRFIMLPKLIMIYTSYCESIKLSNMALFKRFYNDLAY